MRTARWRHTLCVIGLLLGYWAISLQNLTTVPPVYEDEPWQASTGLKLAEQGVFGSDLFAGYYGMESHYYGFMPLHPLLLAGVYRTVGFGLFQTRLETVTLGLLTLALTYALGQRLFGSLVGLWAVILLLVLRLIATTPYQLSGILLVDVARIARYDMAVPVFGLAALQVYLSADRRSEVWRYLLAGLLVGLSGLSHVYGAFWIVVLIALAIWNQTTGRLVAVMVTGCLAPWLAYALYVLRDVPDWMGQTRDYAARFDLLNPAWYWENLLHEPLRYAPGLGAPGRHYLLRCGLWTTLVALPVSLVALARRAVHDHDQAARAIIVPAIVFPILFAMLIHLKLVNYLITVAPVWAVCMAWGGVTLWQRAAPRTNWARLAPVVIGLAVVLEGSAQIVALHITAAQTTPYAGFIAQVRAHIPPGSRVLGLHRYWFGLDDMDYRSWYVPLSQADERYGSLVSIEQALDAVAPDVVLLDARLGAGPDGSPATNPSLRPIYDWLAHNQFAEVALIDDATYGVMEIYRREQAR